MYTLINRSWGKQRPPPFQFSCTPYSLPYLPACSSAAAVTILSRELKRGGSARRGRRGGLAANVLCLGNSGPRDDGPRSWLAKMEQGGPKGDGGGGGDKSSCKARMAAPGAGTHYTEPAPPSPFPARGAGFSKVVRGLPAICTPGWAITGLQSRQRCVKETRLHFSKLFWFSLRISGKRDWVRLVFRRWAPFGEQLQKRRMRGRSCWEWNANKHRWQVQVHVESTRPLQRHSKAKGFSLKVLFRLSFWLPSRSRAATAGSWATRLFAPLKTTMQPSLNLLLAQPLIWKEMGLLGFSVEEVHLNCGRRH